MLNSKISTFLRRVVLDKQSYLNVWYICMTMLLGGFYILPLFLLLPGPSISSDTRLVWATAGILILCTVVASQALAGLERSMIRAWLGLDIPAPVREQGIGGWKRLRMVMTRGVSWKHLFYIYCKATAGFLIADLLLSLLVTACAFFFGSFAYGIAAGIDALFQQHLLAEMDLEHLQLTLIVVQVRPFSGLGHLPWPLAMIRLVFTALPGLVLFIGVLYLNNYLIRIWKRFALYTLIASKKDLQLQEARRLVEQERQKAEQADQKRRELITNVSHELRTPVASIQGHIEALLHASKSAGTTSPTPDVLQRYLDIVYHESLQLGTLVDDLLSLSRAETDTLYLKKEVVDVAEVIAQVYQTLMPLARRERQITLLQEVGTNIPSVIADRQRLTQVLLNLVRNAITNTLDGGLVSMELQKANDSFVVLQVSDTGIGIPLEEQEHIFERFYRADASHSRSSGGVGLGLAIVREFVLAMGGSISVESKVGEGSIFRVLLPIQEPQPRLPDEIEQD